MLAAISSTVYDPFGWIALEVMPVSAFQDRRRRTNRIATLDGGAAFNDFGFSEADKTMVVEWSYNPAIDDAIEYMAQTYAVVNVATPRGLWQAAIETYSKTQPSRITLMPVAKIAG